MKLIERASWVLKGLLLGSIVMLSACSQQYGDGEGRSANNEAGQKIYSEQCASCHGPSGEGGSGGSLIACAACGSEESLVAKIERDMPSAGNPLKGDKAQDVALYILDQFNGSAAGNVSRSLPGVKTMTDQEAIYKIAFELAGRLPTDEEIETFSQNLEGERQVVMGFMEEDYFYERLKDMFNDTMLLDGYREENEPNQSATLDQTVYQLYANDFEKEDPSGDYNVFPDLTWEGDYVTDNGLDISTGYLNYFSQEAIARKPLLMVEYLARNNRDFRELVSAKYTVANRFSFEAFNSGDFGPNMKLVDPDAAESAGALPFATNVEWDEWDSKQEILDYLEVIRLYDYPASGNDISQNYILDEFPYDPRDIKPVQLFYNDSTGRPLAVGVPHSGVITDEIFLNKYTATETNMHRNRARMIYWFFAAKDLLAIEGNREVEDLEFEDFSNSVGTDDPTATNPDCIVCHEVMDPVAKAFADYDLAGLYDTDNFDSVPEHDGAIGWGLSASAFQSSGANGYNNRELQWIGEQIANDAAYPKGIAQMMVSGLTGQPILGQPGLDSPDGYAKAYSLQSELITKAASEFAGSDFNIKELIYAITKSGYYRSTGLFYDDLSTDYQMVGSMRYLPPQLLNQKLRALNSGGWGGDNGDAQDLFDLDDRLNMGGKNSNDVVTDIDSVSGIISALVERMAVDEACDIVRTEFDIDDKNDRELFTLVDDTTNLSAATANGRLAQMNSIRAQISRLYLAALHQEVASDSEEVDIAFDLFFSVLNGEGDSGCDVIGGGDVNSGNGTFELGEVREAWFAVLVYILTDYRFIYS